MVETGSRRWTLARRSGQRLLGNYDLRVVLQFLKAAGGNHISRINARDRSLPSVRDPSLDVADLGCVILDEVNKCGLPVVLNGGGRNQRNSLQSVHHQLGIYELIGEQGIIFVI